mmetsp:Transcript_6221/g.15394  ORF Transcript_6221/g.15394 Transcript_6221/m.15394 type:complete len:214 (+) Transcript_6221:336-977(+)
MAIRSGEIPLRRHHLDVRYRLCSDDHHRYLRRLDHPDIEPIESPGGQAAGPHIRLDASSLLHVDRRRGHRPSVLFYPRIAQLHDLSAHMDCLRRDRLPRRRTDGDDRKRMPEDLPASNQLLPPAQSDAVHEEKLLVDVRYHRGILFRQGIDVLSAAGLRYFDRGSHASPVHFLLHGLPVSGRTAGHHQLQEDLRVGRIHPQRVPLFHLPFPRR